MIYARSSNYCIGNNGDLPWDLPDDYAFFDETTRGCAVIMGRRTYEDHKSLFTDRLNLVVTSQPSFEGVPGIVVCPSLEAAIVRSHPYERAFVIGGVGMFTAVFDRVQQVFETVVDLQVDGDTFLPPFNFSDFETRIIQEHPADASHAAPFTIYQHTRLSG